MVRDDSTSFLAAMLKGVQAKGYEIRRILNSDTPKNAAFFAQFVVIERMAEHGSLACRWQLAWL
jgi:hypothetical protein